MKKVFRIIPVILAAAAVLITAAGCSARSRSDSYTASYSAGMKEADAYAVEEAAYEYEADESFENYESGMFNAPAPETPAEMQEQDTGTVPAAQDRKLIKNASMEVETENLEQDQGRRRIHRKQAGERQQHI